MIIWIASYPKSGNTWVRALISAYFYSKNGKFNFNDLNNIEQFPSKKHLNSFLKNFDEPAKAPEYWVPAQIKINSENKINFFKTHNAMCTINGFPFSNKENTLASIYVVRDPRNVITSLSNHYGLEIDDACEFLINKRKIIFTQNISNKGKKVDEKGNVHFVGSWGEHYESWKNIGFSPIKIIKYENLIKNSYEEFYSILKFLKNFMKVEIKESKIKKTIESCSFDTLKKKEEIEGFFEAPKLEKDNKKVRFFNLGVKNNWKNNLSSKIESKIRKNFSSIMKELGYIR